MIELFIAGYPRSGNTWLNRTLCDLMNAPLQNLPNTEMEWSYSEIREDWCIVRKTHWYVQDWSGNGYIQGSTPRMVFIYRDPRDTAVSVMHYKNATNLKEVIRGLNKDSDKGYGIRSMINGWIKYQPDFIISYEDLHFMPHKKLSELYIKVTGREVSEEKVSRVIERQKFSNLAPQYPHSMRKGIVGDWKNYFTRDDAVTFSNLYQDLLEDLGYEENNSWINWKD